MSKPYLTVAEFIYRRFCAPISLSLRSDAISVVCVSDTHSKQITLPDGDVLIHAGDLTQSGSYDELEAALSWLAAQSHPIKVVVAGNHDTLLDEDQDTPHTKDVRARQRKRLLQDHPEILYLQDSSAAVTAPNGRQLRIYGSPRTPRYGNWAFQYPRSRDIWRDGIDVDDAIDILVTHGPPQAHLDLGYGCAHLLRAVWRIRPRLHVCGHVHAGAGVEHLPFDQVQHAYEQVIAQRTARSLVSFLFAVAVGVMTRRRGLPETVLVNAAVVGGLRDTVRRDAVTVVI